MTDLDNLDALSSRQLHDLAVHRALRHLDVPSCGSCCARSRPARRPPVILTPRGWDAIKLSSLISDAFESGEGDVADSLRPLYLDYLTKHRTDLHAG